MTDKVPDVHHGKFSYSEQVAGLFVPRHPKLERLHEAYANSQEVERTLIPYVSQLLRRWMAYLEDEVITIERGDAVSSELPKGKKSRLIFNKASSEEVVGIQYNFVTDPTEPEARHISSGNFRDMKARERQQIVEQHPEILTNWSTYDAVYNEGLLPNAFIDGYGFIGRGVLAIRTPEGFLQPEEYTSGLGFLRLLGVIEQLIDDADVYSLSTGKRKGEVCLACKRVDP